MVGGPELRHKKYCDIDQYKEIRKVPAIAIIKIILNNPFNKSSFCRRTKIFFDN